MLWGGDSIAFLVFILLLIFSIEILGSIHTYISFVIIIIVIVITKTGANGTSNKIETEIYGEGKTKDWLLLYVQQRNE